MELLSETSNSIMLIEKNIPLIRFHQQTPDMFFSSLELHYLDIVLKFKFNIPSSVFTTSNVIIDECPFLLKRLDKDSLSLTFQLKKAVLNNSSSKETKITKEKVCHNGIIVKALIYTPPKSKKKSLTREQWLITHPLQGGKVSPR